MQTELKKREGKKRKSFATWFEDTGVTYAMLLPNFIMFLVFTLYPMLWTMRFMQAFRCWTATSRTPGSAASSMTLKRSA